MELYLNNNFINRKIKLFTDIIQFLKNNEFKLSSNWIDGLNNSLERPVTIAAADPELLNILKLLLEHGANINLSNRQGNTALHVAGLNKNIAAINLLLSQANQLGLNLESINFEGNTAYEIAVRSESNDIIGIFTKFLKYKRLIVEQAGQVEQVEQARQAEQLSKGNIDVIQDQLEDKFKNEEFNNSSRINNRSVLFGKPIGNKKR